MGVCILTNSRPVPTNLFTGSSAGATTGSSSLTATVVYIRTFYTDMYNAFFVDEIIKPINLFLSVIHLRRINFNCNIRLFFRSNIMLHCFFYDRTDIVSIETAQIDISSRCQAVQYPSHIDSACTCLGKLICNALNIGLGSRCIFSDQPKICRKLFCFFGTHHYMNAVCV